MKVAFIGLGIMGSRMAANLLKNDIDLTVYNRTASAADELVKNGAKLAESAQACVEEAEVIFTMLSKPEVVEELAFGDHGFIGSIKSNAVWADCSTVDPSTTHRFAAKAQEAGVSYLESPVAGTKPHAQDAKLVFFVGGEKAQVEKVEPLMQLMGQKVMHLGETGKAASLKILINGMLGQSMMIYAETLLLGEKMGFAPEFMTQFFPGLPVIAPFTAGKSEMIQQDQYHAQFPLELMLKDMHLLTQTAYEHDHSLYLASLTRELFSGAKANGLGREDFAAVFRYLKQLKA